MLVRHDDKTVYLLGLEWLEVDGGAPAHRVRDYVGKSGTAFYQVLGSRRDGQRVGFTRHVPDINGKKSKTRAYSLAAMLAARGQDGIYFLESGADGWYAVIQGGELLRASGEMLMPLSHAVHAVEALSQALELPVYASSRHLPNAEPFSLADLDGVKRKPRPMEELQKAGGTSLLGLLMFLCVLGGIGYGAWITLRPPQKAATPAQLAERTRQDYANTMLGVMPMLDPEPSWLLDGYAQARDAFPAAVHGWVLTRIACAPAQCGATYVISDDHTTFSLTGMQERFGRERIQLHPNMRELVVTLARQPNPPNWDVERVLNPPVAVASLIDVHGMLRLRVPQAQVEQTMHRASLSQGTQPPDVPGIQSEMIVTSGHDAYPAPTFGRLAEALGPAGFVPEAVELTVPSAGREPSWRVTWIRISREQQA